MNFKKEIFIFLNFKKSHHIGIFCLNTSLYEHRRELSQNKTLNALVTPHKSDHNFENATLIKRESNLLRQNI